VLIFAVKGGKPLHSRPFPIKGIAMHPVHDFDALLILATALASKRRPAELVEIMAAADLLQGSIPSDVKLVEAFDRLARHGLLVAVDAGFALTSDAQQLVADQPKKVESEEFLFLIKERLSAYKVTGEYAPIVLTAEECRAAIQTHRAAGEGAGKNLLVPKPKPEEVKARPGQRQRKPMPARKRKT
jgi:hypothetical protein